ncbi:MAG: adenine deaminase C-terminal domain-containing protein [Acidimicrobiales bacterium]
MNLREKIDAAEGVRKADLVLAGGQLVNVATGEIYRADVAVTGDLIAAVGDVGAQTGPDTTVIDVTGRYLVPGLIDGHLHIECSKLSITMFADAVVRFGTTSAVSGLDQTYAVAGLEGVRDALSEAEASPMKVFWAAPYKVPYTIPETNVGFRLGPDVHEIAQKWPDCFGVWETVTEFITNRDPEVLAVIEMAARNRLPVFGCAPMASEATIGVLAAAGIRLDHESYSAEEVLAKMRAGMYVMVRESAVAHFMEENIQVVTRLGANPGRVGFCTDDVTATSLLGGGHLDRLVRMAIKAGIPPVTAIQMATINTAQMYRIDHLVGSICPGRAADVLVVDDPASFVVERVISKGVLVAEGQRTTHPPQAPARGPALLNTMKRAPLRPDEIRMPTVCASPVRVLAMEMDREVPFVRRRRDVVLPVIDGGVQADLDQDALYVTVVERYGKTGQVPVAIVCGFGLSSGALATSAAPDDNNIICVGTNPADMALAINEVIRLGGGLAVTGGGAVVEALPLPVGGIVADIDVETMAAAEARLDQAARALGCQLPTAFGYLMFLEITSIPDYAITDLGLIGVREQSALEPVLGPA